MPIEFKPSNCGVKSLRPVPRAPGSNKTTWPPFPVVKHKEAFSTLVSFSSRQKNLIKTFQIEGMIALIAKMDLIFS